MGKEESRMNALAIDRMNPQKLYCQLHQILKGAIERGEWKVGARIPTEEQLCAHYRVSKTTVRQSLDELVALGYLNKVQGKGTFVRRRIPEHSIRMAIHLDAERTEFTAEHGYYVIEDGAALPGLEISDYLRIGAGESCRRCTRVQVLGGLPLALEALFIPGRLCVGGLGEQELSAPLARCLESRCAVRIHRIREKTGISLVDGHDAALLGVAPRTPVLRISEIFYKSGDQPVGFAQTARRMDRHERVLEFERL